MVEGDIRVCCVLDVAMFPISIAKDGCAESDGIIDTAETEDNVARLEESLTYKPLLGMTTPAYLSRDARVHDFLHLAIVGDG